MWRASFGIWMLVATVDRCLAAQGQPVVAASSWVDVVDNVLVGPVFVIGESFVPAQVLQACRVLQRRVLDAGVHAKPVPVLHAVRLRGPLGRWLVAVAVVRRWQVARVRVRALARPRDGLVGLV